MMQAPAARACSLPALGVLLLSRYPPVDIRASKPPTRAQAERPEFAVSEEPANSNGVAVQVFGDFLDGHNIRVLARLIPLHFTTHFGALP